MKLEKIGLRADFFYECKTGLEFNGRAISLNLVTGKSIIEVKFL